MKNILNAPFLLDFCRTAANMYRSGWNECNSGNISYLLYEDEVKEYLDLSQVKRTIPCSFCAKELAGMYFLVTGSGKYFMNMSLDPEADLGILRISETGKEAELLWGFREGCRPTSEFPAHMMSHAARLKADPENRVVLHAHPTHVMAMSFVHELNDRAFTRSLWKSCTEGIGTFEEGVGVLPWMVCGTDAIGEATARKIQEFRCVIWAMHGIYASGRNLDDTFGMIETVEKAAQIYLLTASLPRVNTITDEQLRDVATQWKKNYRKDFLNL